MVHGCTRKGHVTINDINTVWFRGTADPKLPSSEMMERVPGYAEYGHDLINWDAISWDNAVHVNEQIADMVEDELAVKNAGAYSTVHMGYESLRERLGNNTTIVNGGTRNFDRTSVDTDNGSGDGGGGGSQGSPNALEDPPVSVARSTLPFKQKYIDACSAFLRQYEDLSKDRFWFLILVGPSQTGKSQFAEYALGFKNPCVVEGGFIMSSYDERTHDAIIFSDTPGLKDLIIRYKALFQSNKHPTCVGESQTNCYSINIRNFRKPIVVTLNDDAGEEWDQMKDHSWIKSNTYRVIVNDQMWEEPTDAGEPSQRDLDEQERAASWRGD